jgi:hypothetical protein
MPVFEGTRRGMAEGDSGFAGWLWRIAGGEHNATRQRLVRTADRCRCVGVDGNIWAPKNTVLRENLADTAILAGLAF